MAWFPCNIGGGGGQPTTKSISYLKWQILRTKSTPSGGYMQAAEFYLYQNGIKYSWDSNVSISSNMNGMPNQGIEMLIDGNTSTKFCTHDWGDSTDNECNIVISLGETITLDSKSSYSYVTGNDEDSRDPVSWKLYGSTDGTNWELLDDVSNATITANRGTETQRFYTMIIPQGNATVKQGTFVSASSQYGIVDVNVGFEPDLVLVEMPLGNNISTVSYWEKDLSYAQTDAIWCLKPAENVAYRVALNRQTGETGIQAINNDGFSFMSNGANTRDVTCDYIAVKYEAEPTPVIEDYITDYFPCLLDSNNYYTVFSKAANDEIQSGGRGGTRASSDPVFYFCCKTTDSFWGYGVIGLTSASVQITATTSYGGATYYTQTTTNGNTIYLARLSSMNGGQASTVFKNGYLKIEIDGTQYIEQNVSTNLFDQTFVDAAYEALTALS